MWLSGVLGWVPGAKYFSEWALSFELPATYRHNMDRVKRIWYLSPMRAAKVQASLCIKQCIKRNLQTESQIPGPSEWLGMRSWNLSWRNARRHKFAWQGSFDWKTIEIDVKLVQKYRHVHTYKIIRATSWENLFMPYANNKGTDQPVHAHRLIALLLSTAWIV